MNKIFNKIINKLEDIHDYLFGKTKLKKYEKDNKIISLHDVKKELGI